MRNRVKCPNLIKNLIAYETHRINENREVMEAPP